MKKAKHVVEIALFVAILSVASQIAIPTSISVPITLQALIVALIGYFLGSKKAVITIFIYILLGLIGAPIFSSFQAGAMTLFSYTGGFIFGFLPLSFFCGIAKKRAFRIVFGILGIIICHLIGTIQYSFVAMTTLFQAFLICSAPFIIKDIILVVLAHYLSSIITKRISRH